MTLGDALRAAAAECPNRCALVEGIYNRLLAWRLKLLCEASSTSRGVARTCRHYALVKVIETRASIPTQLPLLGRGMSPITLV